MEKKLYDLEINEELLKVAPPLSENEMNTLTEDILEHGCIFPLIIWNGVIVDGHNRYQICRENNIPFGIEEVEFDSLTDAKVWIVKNQLGRRNLTDFQRCEMVFPLEAEIAAQAAARKKYADEHRNSAGQKFAPLPKTRDIMANLADVSHTTWDKAKKIILEGEEEMKVQLRTGPLKIHTAYTRLKKKDKPKAVKKDQQESEKKEKMEPAIYVDKPTIFDPMPDMDDTPECCLEDFDEIEAMVEDCIRDFMMNFNAAMKWAGKKHVSKTNEKAVKDLLKEGYEAAVEALENKFNELKGE